MDSNREKQLLEANNAEVERRRKAEQERDDFAEAHALWIRAYGEFTKRIKAAVAVSCIEFDRAEELVDVIDRIAHERRELKRELTATVQRYVETFSELQSWRDSDSRD